MKKVMLIGALLVALAAAYAAWAFFVSPPAPLEAGELEQGEEIRRLNAGEVLVTRRDPTGGIGAAAEAKGVIDAPIERVWPAVRDCEHYSKFMPRVIKSGVAQRNGETFCSAVMDMPWPIDDLTLETRSTITSPSEGAHMRSWKLTTGSFKHYTGSFEVIPFDGDPQRTLVTYTLDIKPDVPIPDVVLRKKQAAGLPEAFAALAQHLGVTRP
jgi:ribosome-associated toxin RatA of RatAB toxin-antitoxin module